MPVPRCAKRISPYREVNGFPNGIPHHLIECISDRRNIGKAGFSPIVFQGQKEFNAFR